MKWPAASPICSGAWTEAFDNTAGRARRGAGKAGILVATREAYALLEQIQWGKTRTNSRSGTGRLFPYMASFTPWPLENGKIKKRDR